GFATFDINQDKADCTDKLVGLVGCLPYVGGGASAPIMIVALVSNKLSTITRGASAFSSRIVMTQVLASRSTLRSLLNSQMFEKHPLT
ncbi:hypothetical protein VIGAN_01232700, partial [Vigna angularis var. angularis]